MEEKEEKEITDPAECMTNKRGSEIDSFQHGLTQGEMHDGFNLNSIVIKIRSQFKANVLAPMDMPKFNFNIV